MNLFGTHTLNQSKDRYLCAIDIVLPVECLYALAINSFLAIHLCGFRWSHNTVSSASACQHIRLKMLYYQVNYHAKASLLLVGWFNNCGHLEIITNDSFSEAAFQDSLTHYAHRFQKYPYNDNKLKIMKLNVFFDLLLSSSSARHCGFSSLVGVTISRY